MITAFIVFLSLGQNAPETTGLPYDRNAKNIATLFTMTNEDGRLENIQIMESIFKDGSLGFKSESHHNKSSKYIYERLESAAKEVGTYGTLLFYVNSHGGGSWKDFSMTAAGGDFKFSKALQAIAKGNKVKNWKQKMLSVWLKPENKETPQSTSRTRKPYIPDEPRRSNKPATVEQIINHFANQPQVSIKLGDYQHLIKKEDTGNPEQQ